MTLSVGDRLPETTFYVMTPDGAAARRTAEIFAGRTAVLVGVPGAFTPTCHRAHLPGYVEGVEAFAAHGVDLVAVTAVNDVFVMDAWAKETGGAGRLTFLADGSGDFARAAGLGQDSSARGMGFRSRRYAMLVRDGVVAYLAVEEPGAKPDVSAAATLLARLDGLSGAGAPAP